MTDLERQLAAYTDFLEDLSTTRTADHTTPVEQQGDVIVVDLMERMTDGGSGSEGPVSTPRPRWPWFAVAAAVALVVATVSLLNVGDEGASEVEVIDQPDPAPTDATLGEAEAEADAPEPEPESAEPADEVDLGPLAGDWTGLDELYNAAIDSGDRSALGDVFSSLMTVSFDGLVGDPPSGFNTMTRAGSLTLNPRRLDDCVVVDDSTVSCQVNITYPALGEVVPEHGGTITFGHDGERIVSMTEATNRGAITPVLVDYQAWSTENHPDDALAMWSGPGGLLRVDDLAVEAHLRIGPLYAASLEG